MLCLSMTVMTGASSAAAAVSMFVFHGQRAYRQIPSLSSSSTFNDGPSQSSSSSLTARTRFDLRTKRRSCMQQQRRHKQREPFGVVSGSFLGGGVDEGVLGQNDTGGGDRDKEIMGTNGKNIILTTSFPADGQGQNRPVIASQGVAPKRPVTRIQQLVMTFRKALSELDASRALSSKSVSSNNTNHRSVNMPTDLQLEKWASVIYESMSAPSRTFHSVQHVFDISAGCVDPIETIAAMFHDVVYFTVDGGFSPSEREILEGLIVDDGTKEDHYLCMIDGTSDIVQINDEIDFELQDPTIAVVMDIFGLERGEQLDPFSGLNEFLSAAIAVRCVEETLDLRTLTEIAACIEATIPFRGVDERGLSPARRLYHSLHDANRKYDLNMSESDVVAATRRAVDLANRDVQNFASQDPGAFLSKAWELLPESNFGLRHSTAYRLSSFSRALGKMSGFFNGLDPNLVFQPPFCTRVTVHGEEGGEGLVAATDAVQRMTARASRNMKIARTYMRAELLSFYVLGALAELTGGDAPMALFLGDSTPSDARDGIVLSPSMEHYVGNSIDDDLPSIEGKDVLRDDEDVDPVVLELLRDGREGACDVVPEMEHSWTDKECNTVLKKLPLAAYLYEMLGSEGIKRGIRVVGKQHPSTKQSARRLLNALPPKAVREIAMACANVAGTRADLLLDIVQEYRRYSK